MLQKYSSGGVGDASGLRGTITSIREGSRGTGWATATVKLSGGGSQTCSFQPFIGLSQGVTIQFDLVADSRMRTGCRAANVKKV